MAKKYILKLTAEERAGLTRLVRKGNVAGRRVQRAQALLECDQGAEGPARPDARIAEAFGITTRSPGPRRKRAVEHGPMARLQRRPRATAAVLELGGANEARPTALACSRPPKGRARWSLRLLAERLVELEVVGAVSHETARRSAP